MSFTLRHTPELNRYELLDGDDVIGTASYQPSADGVDWEFNSTVVLPAYGGQGLAAKLVNFALTDAKANGHTITATCSYVVTYLRKHPELAS